MIDQQSLILLIINTLQYWHTDGLPKEKQRTMRQHYDISIAVIDDDPHWGACLSQMLAVSGYDQTSVFTNLADYLHDFGPRPDLIFLDHALENMDGLQALQQIQWQSPSTAVVYCTGHNELRVAVAAMKSGAVDFLPKSKCTPLALANLMQQLADRLVFADKVY